MGGGRGGGADPACPPAARRLMGNGHLRHDPCLETVRRPATVPTDRIRVVELLATGTTGGAQEHVFSLGSRMDQSRFDVSVVSLSPGSAVRKLERAGFDVLVIDEPDDAIAVGALAAHLSEVRADVIHNHMFRAETIAARGAMPLAEIGHRRPYVVSTIHSSRIRSEEDR